MSNSHMEIWVPHAAKMAVRDLPEGVPPWDPPLVPGQEDKLLALVMDMVGFGEPDLIFVSPRQRAQQTAALAIKVYGRLNNGPAQVITMDCLAQADSGDPDPENPQAEPDTGLVKYSSDFSVTGPADWWQQFLTSRDLINSIAETMRTKMVWVFTHRPLCAAAVLATEIRHWEDVPNSTLVKRMDPMDPGLKPYSAFRAGRPGVSLTKTLEPSSDYWRPIRGGDLDRCRITGVMR